MEEERVTEEIQNTATDCIECYYRIELEEPDVDALEDPLKGSLCAKHKANPDPRDSLCLFNKYPFIPCSLCNKNGRCNSFTLKPIRPETLH